MTKNMNTSVVALVVVTILLMLMPYSLVSNGTVEVAVEEGSIPDGDCLFEPFLAKCTPDKNGECPEGFGKNALAMLIAGVSFKNYILIFISPLFSIFLYF